MTLITVTELRRREAFNGGSAFQRFSHGSDRNARLLCCSVAIGVVALAAVGLPAATALSAVRDRPGLRYGPDGTMLSQLNWLASQNGRAHAGARGGRQGSFDPDAPI